MSATIEMLEAKALEIAKKREEYDEASRKKTEIGNELETLEMLYIQLLKENNKTSYESNVGRFTITHKTSVRIPRDFESKQAFFNFLKERGIYDQMISINSQTLNSFFKQEFESAKEAGTAEDFSMPGIEPPQVSETIMFRKK